MGNFLTYVYDKKPSGKILRKLRAEYYDEDVTVWVGKKGLTESIINEIKKQLENRKVVKIRVLKNALIGKSRKEGMIEIAKKLIEKGLYVVDIRGYTILVSKKL